MSAVECAIKAYFARTMFILSKETNCAYTNNNRVNTTPYRRTCS